MVSFLTPLASKSLNNASPVASLMRERKELLTGILVFMFVKSQHLYFEIEKNINDTNFLIANVKVNNQEKKELQNQIFQVKNIQNLRSHIRQIIN